VSEEKKWGPAWRYGPGGAAEIFENEKDVPKGWEDHPSKVKEPAPKKGAKDEIEHDL